MARIIRLLCLIAVGVVTLALVSPRALPSGGTARYKHDNSGSDGWCTFFANGQDGNRWNVRYNANELDPGAVVCQGHAWFFNFQTKTDPTSPNYDPRDLYTTMDLRAEDPATPGYPDLSPAGVLAQGGSYLVPPGYRHVYSTFNTAIDSSQTIFLSWSEPLTTAPAGGNVCQMIDTNRPPASSDPGSSNDSVWRLADGTPGYEQTWDYIAELNVFEPKTFNLRVNTRGSQRFPGDHGIPVVFVRRDNNSAFSTDDFISLDIVVDNAGSSPVNGNVKIEVDRGIFAGQTGVWQNITKFFTPRIANPVVFAPGRTIITGRVPRPVSDSIVRLLPVNVPARVTITDPGTQALLDGEPGVWGLRPSPGEVDSAADSAAYLVRSPAFTNDSIAVRFMAQDLPRSAPFVVTGLEVAGIEIGGSGLNGFDAIEFRVEDPVLQTPDLSPSGLIRSMGTKDGVGEIPLGGPGGVVVNRTINVMDAFIDPTVGASTNFWVEVFYQPGDSGTYGTLIMMDNKVSTRFPYTFFTTGDAVYKRRDDFTTKNYNAEIRLKLDGRSGTIEDPGSSRVTNHVPSYVNMLEDPVPQAVRTGIPPQ